MNEAAVKFETYNSGNPTVNRLLGFKYSKIQREGERERVSTGIYQSLNSMTTERERSAGVFQYVGLSVSAGHMGSG